MLHRGVLSQDSYLPERSSPFSGDCVPSVQIIEQPASVGARFRYKCEGRSAGCIRGINSTEKDKTYPSIKVVGYQGAAGVVVSCVTKDGPPYYPHPHNLVGKSCVNGICYKPIENADMICSFPNIGIQCVKRKDVKDSLIIREALKVDPFGTGFSHISEPSKINLNALCLCFQVFIPDSNGKLSVPLHPIISSPIFDNKTVSDLTIIRLSHYSAPITGGQEIILLCNQVNKDDIQVIFYEESDSNVVWSAQGNFSPHHVHRKAAITFRTPAYRDIKFQGSNIECFVQLRRPSDGALGKARTFTLLSIANDPDGLARKRSKFESLCLEKVLHSNNLSINVNMKSPRLIKHAVRSKANVSNSQNGSDLMPAEKDNFQHNVSLNQKISSYCKTDGTIVTENRINSEENLLKSSFSNVHSCSSVQRGDDFLTFAVEEINIQESPFEDTLDKLSSLDLSLDSDLDVNLSGIILDSFSGSSGLNISLQSIDVKNSA